MKQVVEKSEKSEIKTLVSQNFIGAMEEMAAEGIVKNSRQLSAKIKSNQSNFSKIKKGEGRYITLDSIYEAVNELGLNANFIFVEDGAKKEELLREGVVNNIVSGNNNKVTNVTPVFQGSVTGNISVAEKIIQDMPPKARREMKKHMDGIKNELADLKKTLDDCKRQLREKEKELKEKDKKLMNTQEQLIKLMMEKK